MSHPEVDARPCSACERYVWALDKPSPEKEPNGRYMLRKPGSQLPCQACVKCKGQRNPSPRVGRQRSLSPKNRKTLERYFEYQACHEAPTDPIARQNFGIIEELFRSHGHDSLRMILHYLPMAVRR